LPKYLLIDRKGLSEKPSKLKVIFLNIFLSALQANIHAASRALIFARAKNA